MITKDELVMEIEALSFEGDEKKFMEALERYAARAEKERKRVRRAFWFNILTGAALLFLAMVCLEIVT